MQGHTFVSYASADRAYVEVLSQHLASEGIDVWFDYRIVVGQNFSKIIQDMIDDCSAIIVVMSPASMASDWVLREIQYGLDKGKPILPIMLNRCGPSLLLTGYHYEEVAIGRPPSIELVTQLRELQGSNVRPLQLDVSARLMAILGESDASAFDCIAQIIDSLRRISDHSDTVSPPIRVAVSRTWLKTATGNGHSEIRIAANAALNEARLENFKAPVSDEFRGMSQDLLDRFGLSLQLAVARLGSSAEVRTTRAGDASWLSLALAKGDLAARGVVKIEPNFSPAELDIEATEVIVSELRDAAFQALGVAHLRRELGLSYSYAIAAGTLEIEVNEVRVWPQLACVWGGNRYVLRNKSRVPAVIGIDVPLMPGMYCINCSRLAGLESATSCPACGAEVVLRERRIWGWLGIQRYLHQHNFGIDFIYRGRTILRHDKSCFNWIDPNTGGSYVEYPIDLPHEGRIIGEIHVDFLRINSLGNGFDMSSAEWKATLHSVRGEGPIRPSFAKRLGYPVNDSPLALLLAGFRRNDPGLNYLIPGDGNGPIHDLAREWGRRFHEGDPAYADDKQWFEAAVDHERSKETRFSQPRPTF